jgi:hypothetical protein
MSAKGLSIAISAMFVTFRRAACFCTDGHEMDISCGKANVKRGSKNVWNNEQDKVWLTGVDGAAKKKLLKKLGITHILNMSGSDVYSLAAVPSEEAYFPNDFTYKVLISAPSTYPTFLHL